MIASRSLETKALLSLSVGLVKTIQTPTIVCSPRLEGALPGSTSPPGPSQLPVMRAEFIVISENKGAADRSQTVVFMARTAPSSVLSLLLRLKIPCGRRRCQRTNTAAPGTNATQHRDDRSRTARLCFRKISGAAGASAEQVSNHRKSIHYTDHGLGWACLLLPSLPKELLSSVQLFSVSPLPSPITKQTKKWPCSWLP